MKSGLLDYFQRTLRVVIRLYHGILDGILQNAIPRQKNVAISEDKYRCCLINLTFSKLAPTDQKRNTNQLDLWYLTPTIYFLNS